MFGDLLFAIVNNGVHVPDWIQRKLKGSASLDSDFRQFMMSLNLTSLSGCSSEPLQWKLTNYQIVCDSPDICEYAVRRFFGIYPDLDKSALVKSYFDINMHDKIDRCDISELEMILARKYRTVQISPLVSSEHCLDIGCIFDRQSLLKMLEQHFDFDHDLACQQYFYWWQREQTFLEKFTYSV